MTHYQMRRVMCTRLGVLYTGHVVLYTGLVDVETTL